MGGMKTYIRMLASGVWVALGTGIGAFPAPVAAQTLTASATTTGHLPQIAVEFAVCTGRLSALMEHQWLISDPAADETHDLRAAMIQLLEAVTTPQTARAALYVRIDAKVAHAGLLTRATFNTDPKDADWAKHRASEQIGACQAMLLS